MGRRWWLGTRRGTCVLGGWEPAGIDNSGGTAVRGWEVLGSGEEKSGTRQRAQDTSQHLAGTRWAPGEHRQAPFDRQIQLAGPLELLKHLSCRAHSHAQRSLWLPIQESLRNGATSPWPAAWPAAP